YVDSGYVNPETKCLCGRPLRYQYIAMNKTTGETITFGKDHFEQHTGIPTKVVREVIQGVGRVDYELTEILTKVSDGWFVERYIDIEYLPGLDLPKDIAEHLDLGLPLLQRHLRRLNRLIQEKRRQSGLSPEPVYKEDEEVPLENATLFDFSSETPIEQQVDEFLQSNYGIDEEDKEKELSKQKLSTLGRRLYGATEVKRPLHSFLNDREVKLINDYIENEKYDEDYGINALELCEGLIKRGSFKDTYITDKPKIYPYVANYLDFLVAQGYLVMISDLGTVNKVYTKAV
ncbi:DUF3895 domain-containing protein, partial [Bacillus cereus]|uniref:DUF3895 domain-containing protein n=1 Tax=Bacillus cereus TaxID=1396 RepID=UPI003D1730D3